MMNLLTKKHKWIDLRGKIWFLDIETFKCYQFFPSLEPLLLIGSMKLISGLIIEGWKWGGSKKHSTVNWNSGVTHYSVEFSPGGRPWTVIKDENGLPSVRDINASLITLSLRRACLYFNACFCCMKRLRLYPHPPPPFTGKWPWLIEILTQPGAIIRDVQYD